VKTAKISLHPNTLMKVGCWTIKINIAHLAVTYLLC